MPDQYLFFIHFYKQLNVLKNTSQLIADNDRKVIILDNNCKRSFWFCVTLMDKDRQC